MFRAGFVRDFVSVGCLQSATSAAAPLRSSIHKTGWRHFFDETAAIARQAYLDNPACLPDWIWLWSGFCSHIWAGARSRLHHQRRIRAQSDGCRTSPHASIIARGSVQHAFSPAGQRSRRIRRLHRKKREQDERSRRCGSTWSNRPQRGWAFFYSQRELSLRNWRVTRRDCNHGPGGVPLATYRDPWAHLRNAALGPNRPQRKVRLRISFFRGTER